MRNLCVGDSKILSLKSHKLLSLLKLAYILMHLISSHEEIIKAYN